MRLIVKVCKVFLLCCSLLLISCAAKDFKVVDALRKGMSMDEAKSTIESYSFERKSITTRPKSGWVENDETFTRIPGRALRVEKELNTKIKTVEYYPVGHGLLGFGQLFLFYDENDILVYYYRKQIN